MQPRNTIEKYPGCVWRFSCNSGNSVCKCSGKMNLLETIKFKYEDAKSLGLMTGGAIVLFMVLGIPILIFQACRGFAWIIENTISLIIRYPVRWVVEALKTIIAWIYIAFWISVFAAVTTILISVLCLFFWVGYYLSLHLGLIGMLFTMMVVGLYFFFLYEIAFVLPSPDTVMGTILNTRPDMRWSNADLE